MSPTPGELWSFLLVGYLMTVAIEVPVLVLGLSPRHALRHRLVAGIWLTACTYPIVVLVLPHLVWQPFGRTAYLIIAETFAPAAECALFWMAYGIDHSARHRDTLRDMGAIVAANLASFTIGLILIN